MPEAKAADAPPKNQASGGAGPGQRVDPYRGYNFSLIIDGVSEGHFTECSGLGAKVAPIRYREGGNAQIVHQLVGPVEYAEVTLRYGLTNSPELWAWFMSAVHGTPQRKNVSIVMLTAGGIGEGLRWNLNDAWPTEWRGAPLDALGKEIAIETLALVYESLTRA